MGRKPGAGRGGEGDAVCGRRPMRVCAGRQYFNLIGDAIFIWADGKERESDACVDSFGEWWPGG